MQIFSPILWVVSLSLFFLKCILFIYFWLHWVFIAACGLSRVAASGGYFSLLCSGFSLQGLLIVVASLVVEHGLWAHGLQ